MEEQVILVDEQGGEMGVMEKMAAHRAAVLHRAFSVFIFNSAGQLLLQRRADHKYHSGGLWTNTCCSHPRPGEGVVEAARRRLQEEMGLDCDLQEVFAFTYHARLDHDLYEHEYDHVLVGRCDADPTPNPEEVSEWKWVDPDKLEQDRAINPQNYTAWFHLAFPRVLSWLR
jgi:isopentenyl-diphosphate delta-isomerase